MLANITATVNNYLQLQQSHDSFNKRHVQAKTFLVLNSEVSIPKKQYLLIFMRALLTTIIGQCRVKALNTELATACLYKAVMKFMTSQST